MWVHVRHFGMVVSGSSIRSSRDLHYRPFHSVSCERLCHYLHALLLVLGCLAAEATGNALSPHVSYFALGMVYFKDAFELRDKAP